MAIVKWVFSTPRGRDFTLPGFVFHSPGGFYTLQARFYTTRGVFYSTGRIYTPGASFSTPQAGFYTLQARFYTPMLRFLLHGTDSLLQNPNKFQYKNPTDFSAGICNTFIHYIIAVSIP